LYKKFISPPFPFPHRTATRKHTMVDWWPGQKYFNEGKRILKGRGDKYTEYNKITIQKISRGTRLLLGGGCVP